MNLSVAALVAPLALGIVGCEKKTEEAAKPAAAASAAAASAAARDVRACFDMPGLLLT